MVEEGKPSKSKKSKASKKEEKGRGDDAGKQEHDVKDAVGKGGAEMKDAQAQAGSTLVVEVERTPQVDQQAQLKQEQPLKGSNEVSINLVEVRADDRKVLIGPARLTRFEKARIVGARALQLSLGAPPLIQIPKDAVDPISIAEYELSSKALPISIRRILPDGHYQDIPIAWLMN
ncbi:hypothetical protein HRbin04_00934 [archaeon HR04]|nr:hypothetical protein HRbin04_00934 [archaeon HR04]